MNENELRAILELKLIRGLGDVGLRRLLRRHATAARALEAFRNGPRAATQRTPNERRAQADRIERALDFIEASDITVRVEREASYPARLRNLNDPPPVLFCAGDVSLATAPSAAVVGSRRHTEYGATATEMIVAGLTHADIVIVSGLARGIDRIAHETALCAGGRTIAVLGCGIDVAYPPEHLELQEAIGRAGLVLSEFVPGEPPARHNFPRRNRILAALAHALIVVEAGPKSGALITVDHALDLGLDVFAVPGPIGRTTSDGTNGLIQDGAGLLRSTAPVLDAVFGPGAMGDVAALPDRPGRVPTPSSQPPSLSSHLPSPRSLLPNESGDGRRSLGGGRMGSGVGRRGLGGGKGGSGEGSSSRDSARTALLSVLGATSIHIDDAARRANVRATDALVLLLDLELEGVVRQLPGMRFARRAAVPESHPA